MDLNNIMNTIANGLITYIKTKPYGIVHKTAPIRYLNKDGILVWDYIILNELTFEDIETREKYSLAQSASDTEIEETFNALVNKFGI